MKVVEIGSKAESLNRSFDIFLNMSGGIGNAAVPKGVESAFRGNCRSWSVEYFFLSFLSNVLKILSRRLCFLIKSPRSFSFTPAAYTT